MKKVVALLLALAMAFSLVACGGTSGESSGEVSSAASSEASASADAEGESGSGSVTNEEEVSTASSEAEAEAEASSILPEGLALEEGAEYKVGIVNWVDDASLNQIVENLEAELDAIGAAYGVTFNYGDYYSNAQADQTVLAQIGADLLADEVDVIVAVATPTAAVMQTVTEDTDIPVVFAAVSDPVGSELVDSMDAPGGNLTGTSDALDTETILNLALAADPDMATLGLLYNTSEDSSTQAIADAKAWCEENGIAYEEKTGSTTDDVLLAAQSLISDGVDAVFTPSDNTVMTAELTIYELFQEAQIPHYCGADSFALNGAFLGYGVDYALLGATTGDMVAEILAGADPATTPVCTFDNGIASINTETCEAIGFDLAEIEELFAPLCTQIVELTTAESFE
ncbi:MAG: ABC transporter substrate-binding protein [Clostridiales bacterium]|nr:ABC transporter substrate-binding protein [Clostridiales bacterium]